MILMELSIMQGSELQTQSVSLQKWRLRVMTLTEKLTPPLCTMSMKLLVVLTRIRREQRTERKQGWTRLVYAGSHSRIVKCDAGAHFSDEQGDSGKTMVN